MATTFTLKASCPDQVGIIAAISGLIAEHGASITEASQHSDPLTGHFFMRYEIAASDLPFGKAGFEQSLRPLAQRFGMDWAGQGVITCSWFWFFSFSGRFCPF